MFYTSTYKHKRLPLPQAHNAGANPDYDASTNANATGEQGTEQGTGQGKDHLQGWEGDDGRGLETPCLEPQVCFSFLFCKF